MKTAAYKHCFLMMTDFFIMCDLCDCFLIYTLRESGTLLLLVGVGSCY